MARALLVLDFKDVAMSQGEKRFLQAPQGGIIQGQSTLESWREVRKELSPPVSPSNLKRHHELLDEFVGFAVKSLIAEARCGFIPTSKLFRRFSARTVLGVYLGQYLSVEEIDTIVDSFRRYYTVSPLLVLATGNIRFVKRFVEDRLNPYIQTINKALKRALFEGTEGVLIQVLTSKEEEQVLDSFRGTIAGQGILATSLEWITYSLARDKSAQGQLRDAVGTANFSGLCKIFLEETARKFPSVTFILRENMVPIYTTRGSLPRNSLFAIPLFTLPDQKTENSKDSSDSTYNLQFSPGLRICLGRHLSEAVHRSYIAFLLKNTPDISCLNQPTPVLSFTLIRPDKEFQFQFSH